MPTKLLIALLAAALAAPACTSDEEDPITPTPTPVPVTETFAGTLTRNGADTHPFTVTAAGSVRASIANLVPDATVIVGLSLGTWNGAACQAIISNDNASLGTALLGTADRAGRLCVRIYDAAGTLPAPTDYELTVIRP
jgi:hypothetical protein